MYSLSRCAIVLSFMMIFGVPLSAAAQDATSTPSLTPITINVPADQVVGADNAIDLNKVAQACQPACQIGLEAVYFIDVYNRVDENKAMVIGFDRELHPTVPQGMSAVLFQADGLNLLVPLNSVDRAPQGTWVVAVFIQGEIPYDDPIRIYNVITPSRCSGYNCELPQFDGMDIFSTMSPHCGSIQIPFPDSLVILQSEENGGWVVEPNPVNIPSFCGRIWIFIATRERTVA